MAIVETVGPKSVFNLNDKKRISKEDWRHYTDTLEGSKTGKLYGFNEYIDVLTRAHSDGVLTDSLTSIVSDNVNALLNNYVYIRNRIVSSENKYRFDVGDDNEKNAYTILDNIAMSINEITGFIIKSDYRDEVDIQTVLRRIDIIRDQINIDRQYLPEFKEIQDRKYRESLDRFLELKEQYRRMSLFGRAFDNIRSSITHVPTIKEQIALERRDVVKNTGHAFASSSRLDNPNEYIQFINSKNDDNTQVKRRTM